MRKTKAGHIKQNYSFFFPLIAIIGLTMITVLSSFYEPGWSFNWSGIDKEIKDSIIIAKKYGITSRIGGNGKRLDVLVDRRKWIMNNATVDELLKLTNYPNGVVKTIAYEGLIRNRKFNDKREIIFKALNDDKYPIEYQAGCIGTPMYIREYLMDNVLYIDNSFPLPPGAFNQINLSETDIQSILEEFVDLPRLFIIR